MEKAIGVRSRMTEGDPVQKLTPCLWFDSNAEEAVEFYVSVFRNSKITGLSRYGEAGAEVSGRPAGSVMTITFQLEGQDFMALNGGPVFTFSPAISFIVDCKSQEELDVIWEKFAKGGVVEQCGWLRDKFGISWQIVPSALGEMMRDNDPQKRNRVMKALLQMKKLDIRRLQEAYEGS